MEISQIKKILAESPAIKLIRSRNYANFETTLLFMAEEFSKEPAVVSERLHKHLEDYLGEANLDLNDEESGHFAKTNEEIAKRWIKSWADEGYLANYRDENGNVVYELSYYTSKVLDWIESLKKEEYVGTESKFKSLFDGLKELVEFTNEDRAKRIEMLKEKRLELDRQIQSLEMGDEVTIYEEYQIVPRYNSLTKLAKELLTDFKEVDDNFRMIIRQIYRQQTENTQKNRILRYIFNAYDDLKASQQGKSFYAFWDFLRSSDLQKQWVSLTDSLYQTLHERGIEVSDVFIRDMKQHLNDACEKVNGTNLRMSEKLSRLIRQNDGSASAALTAVINDIRKQLVDIGISGDFLAVGFCAEEIRIAVPFDRQLACQPNREATYKDVPEAAAVDISQLARVDMICNPFAVDRDVLRSRIDSVLADVSQATLKEIIDRHGGISKGLSEVVAYLCVLAQYKVLVNEDATESIMFNHQDSKSIELPEIIITQ